MILETAGLLLLALVALYFGYPTIKAARRQRMLQGWPRVKGTILEQQLLRSGQTLRPEFLVRYRHQEREFTTRCGSPDAGGYTAKRSGTPRAARRYLAARPVGAPIEIMVDPAHGSQAFLVERELPLTLIAVLVNAIMLAFIVATATLLF